MHKHMHTWPTLATYKHTYTNTSPLWHRYCILVQGKSRPHISLTLNPFYPSNSLVYVIFMSFLRTLCKISSKGKWICFIYICFKYHENQWYDPLETLMGKIKWPNQCHRKSLYDDYIYIIRNPGTLNLVLPSCRETALPSLRCLWMCSHQDSACSALAALVSDL